MKKNKRLVAMTALFALSLGLFSGCGSDSAGSTPDSTPTPEVGAPEGSDPLVNEDGYYLHNGHISRVEYPMSEDSIGWAAYVFQSVKDMYLADRDSGIYLCIIPDKNALLATAAGVDCMDYEAFYASVYEQTGYMTGIDIRDTLSLEDYYTGDSHWRQECIVDAAQLLAQGMGVSLPSDYETLTALEDFKGAYHKQYPEEVQAESLLYLSNDIMKGFIVKDVANGKPMKLYDLSLSQGSDPYSMFLGGAMSIITIENPAADTDRELVIFRDSFGSAIAPLLAQGYAKTTVIDLRYITASFLSKFVSFEDQDVLFLYSTLLLNSSAGLKK